MTARAQRPPRLAEWLLYRVLRPGIRRESILGDLREEYADRIERSRPATRWYWMQALRIVVRWSMQSPRQRSSRDFRSERDRGDPMVTTILRDVLVAIRGFRRAPAFVAIAIATIALGVGANTAIFSVVNGVVLRPLPYPRSHAIVRPWAEKIFSRQMLLDVRERVESFAAFGLYDGTGGTLVRDGTSERLSGGGVTASHFEVMGVSPAIGRIFNAEDENSNAEAVVILSDALWRRAFGADPNIIGRRVPLEAEGVNERTVIGVMPAGYEPLFPNWSFWIPIPLNQDAPGFGSYRFRALARLAPTVSIEQARADLARLTEEFSEIHPTQFRPIRRSPIPVLTLHEAIVGNVRGVLFIVLGAVGVILLIACVNVANLLLARAGARERDMAVRLALGAGRRRLVRQLMTETTVLGVIGGIAGVMVAAASLRALVSRLPGDVPRTNEIGIDPLVLVFALVASLLAALIFGTLPAVRATATSPGEALREGGRGGMVSRTRHRINTGFVVAEVALAMVLVTGSGLLLKSFARLSRVDPGFDASRLIVMEPLPPLSAYATGEARIQYFDQVIERVGASPGVEGVTTVSHVPMTGANSGIPYLAEGQPVPADHVSQVIKYREVEPGYFRTMGIPLVAGRDLSRDDNADAQSVGVINKAAADAHWPGEDPLGRRLQFSDGSPWLTIVGVAANIRQHQLDLASRPLVYVPRAQGRNTTPALIVRTAGDPALQLTSIRDVVQSVDPRVPIVDLEAMTDLVTASLGESRFFTTLFAGFAVIALLLGGVGVYGVMAYVTSQRMRELGVRVALGAAPHQILRTSLLRAMTPVALGILCGVVAAVLATRLLQGLLFQVPSTDPVVFVTVALMLAGAGGVSAYLPARRASRADPVAVLAGD